MSNNIDDAVSTALKSKTIAVVGLSKDPSRPSYDVASYLNHHGYRIIPINPTVPEVMGQKSYESLSRLPDELKTQVDVVDIFRKAEDVPPIVDQVVELHAKYGRPSVVWMQLGIVNEPAAQKARSAGLIVVMDRCMKIEHAKRSG